MASGYTTPPVYALNQPLTPEEIRRGLEFTGYKLSRIAQPKSDTKVYAVTQGEPATAQFDKLVTVSKIFLDVRFTELQKRVRELEMTLFWRDHNCVKLREAMAFSNEKSNGPNCKCLSCGMADRVGNSHVLQEFSCSFQPYFEKLLEECGITYKSSNW
jgi:hypothetical protein